MGELKPIDIQEWGVHLVEFFFSWSEKGDRGSYLEVGTDSVSSMLRIKCDAQDQLESYWDEIWEFRAKG